MKPNIFDIIKFFKTRNNKSYQTCFLKLENVKMKIIFGTKQALKKVVFDLGFYFRLLHCSKRRNSQCQL